MSQETFLKIIGIEELKFNKHIGLPLLPAVRHNWSGSRVADWLISGGMVNESKRSMITEKLDGDRFLYGDINGILTKEEIDTVNSKLAKGISKRSSQVLDCFKSSPMRSAFFRRNFYMDLNLVSSTEEVERRFKQEYSPAFPIAHPVERIKKEKLAIRQEYQGKEIEANSFTSHNINICGRVYEYFTCDTLGKAAGSDAA